MSSAEEAQAAGIETVDVPEDNSKNPLARMANSVKVAQAASRGDVIMLAGANGPINLIRSLEDADVSVVGDSDIDFGRGRIFVGDLPGLAALDGIGNGAPPAVVLGMDVLRNRPKMLFKGQQNEVYF